MPSAAQRLAPLALLIVACAAPPQRPSGYLDPSTGATITNVAAPLVFARARLELAYGARDYVTLAATSVNRSGHVEQIFVGYVWSTIDPRMRRAPEPAERSLVIVADDRDIVLSANRRAPQDVGVAAPPGSNAVQRLYPTDAATLRFLAAARELRLTIRNDSDPRPFELWGDGRGALLQYLASVGRD
jgi:hypothetical protein